MVHLRVHLRTAKASITLLILNQNHDDSIDEEGTTTKRKKKSVPHPPVDPAKDAGIRADLRARSTKKVGARLWPRQTHGPRDHPRAGMRARQQERSSSIENPWAACESSELCLRQKPPSSLNKAIPSCGGTIERDAPRAMFRGEILL